MMKFTRIFALIMIVLAGAYCSCGESEYDPDYGLLRAVSADAGIVVKSSDICGLCDALNNDNQIWAQLKVLPRFQAAAKTINTLDTIAKSRHNVCTLLKGRNAIVSFNDEGGDKVSVLVGVEIPIKDANVILQTIVEVSQKHNYGVNKKEYGNKVIREIAKKGTSLCYISYQNGLMLIGTSQSPIEQAMRHVKSSVEEVEHEKALKPLLKWAGHDVQAVLIFNHKMLGEMFERDLSASSFRTVISHAGWSVLDLSLGSQEAKCIGFTEVSQSKYNLSIVKSQQPVKNLCAEYLPSKTTAFVSLGISDMHMFAHDYENHLRAINMYKDFQTADASITKDYNVDFSQLLYGNIVDRITEFSCTFSLAGRANDHYIIAELRDSESFEKQIGAICRKYRQTNKIADKDGLFKVKTSAGNTYRVYKYPLNNTFHRYFGEMFSSDAYYCMFYNGKAVFGRTVDALYEYANNIDNGKILANNSMYANFSANISSESNVYYYIDLSYSQDDVSRWLSTGNSNSFKRNFGRLQYLRSLAIQYTHDNGDVFYTNAAMIYSTTIEADRSISWLAKTDTSICS
ncbi:MAG: hypothetical protein K6F33_12375, partial [Bacteroidales bacterium]|nr:hypothetical protein [Bacteroidales bacterium]